MPVHKSRLAVPLSPRPYDGTPKGNSTGNADGNSTVEAWPKACRKSDYKAAVLAGIAHKLKMLDRMETSHSRSIDEAAGSRTDQSRGFARAGRNG
jgi:hypothetical protein